VGRRPVVLGGALCFAAASLALAVAGGGSLFVALRVLQALGASAALVATFATVRDVYADRPEGRMIYSQFG
ncbi:CmlA/FloR family chloramphenicol efflux MFS transporter, partial [Clostridioides difficile]|nr:CmlA/FloR family chloramphenicol efflux MFS transporter [Clostridioides difficile]